MKLNRWLMAAAMSAALSFGLSQGLAQNDQGGGQGGGPGGPGGPGGGRRGNFDPAQFRERMMERAKEALEVTDDTEWKALEPLVQKVMDARMGTMSGMGRGMFGPPRRQGGDGGGDQPQRRGPFGDPSPEAEALQKAIDAKAPKAEIKEAMAKFVAARKAKQAELETAQESLRKVLTSRQEAIATLYGWL